MSYERIIERFNKIKFDSDTELTNKEIDQLFDGHIFDEFIFNTINETCKVSLWYLDLLTLKIHIDKRAYKILGLEPGEFEHDLIRALKTIIHPAFSNYVNTFLATDLLKQDSKALSFKIIRKDGTEAWIAIKGHYLNGNPNSRSAVGIIADVTELITQKESITNYEKFLNTILETVPTPIFFKDLDGKYQKFNKAFLDLLGLKSSDLLGKTVFEIHNQETADFYHNKDMELMEFAKQQIYEAYIDTASNGKRLVKFYKELLYNSNNEPTGIVGSLYDITETSKKELKLKRMNLLLRSLIEVSQAVLEISTMKDLFQVVIEKALDAIPGSDFGCILIKDEDDYLTIIAQKGYDQEESDGFKIKFQDSFSYTFSQGNLKSPIIINDIPSIADQFPQVIPSEYETFLESSLCTPIIINNEVYALVNVDSKSTNVFDDYDIELMTILKNQIELVIQNVNLYKQVVEISQTDPLTSVFNRGYFENSINGIVKRAERYNETFCLIIIDLNNLKVVNDLLGHNIGDKYITNFSEMFTRHIRESDILARYGGDEFIAVFFSNNVDEITNRMEAINKEFMSQTLSENNNFLQSFSYGIARYPDDADKYTDLARIADENMYYYKRKIKSGILSFMKK